MFRRLKEVHLCLESVFTSSSTDRSWWGKKKQFKKEKASELLSTDTSIQYTIINHNTPQKQLPRATIISAFQPSAAVTVTSNLTVGAKGKSVKHQRWMRGPQLRKWIIHQTRFRLRGADDGDQPCVLKQTYAVISTLTRNGTFHLNGQASLANTPRPPFFPHPLWTAPLLLQPIRGPDNSLTFLFSPPGSFHHAAACPHHSQLHQLQVIVSPGRGLCDFERYGVAWVEGGLLRRVLFFFLRGGVCGCYQGGKRKVDIH